MSQERGKLRKGRQGNCLTLSGRWKIITMMVLCRKIIIVMETNGEEIDGYFNNNYKNESNTLKYGPHNGGRHNTLQRVNQHTN